MWRPGARGTGLGRHRGNAPGTTGKDSLHKRAPVHLTRSLIPGSLPVRTRRWRRASDHKETFIPSTQEEGESDPRGLLTRTQRERGKSYPQGTPDWVPEGGRGGRPTIRGCEGGGQDKTCREGSRPSSLRRSRKGSRPRVPPEGVRDRGLSPTCNRTSCPERRP